MNIDSFIHSKHYIFKQSLFSTTKRLLTIKFSSLHLDSIPFSPSLLEIIEFCDIQKIDFSEKNDKDFIIVYRKKNQQFSLEFSSYYRAFFIIEFYKAQDLWKCSKKNMKDLFEITAFQVFCEKEREEVKLELTRTCLKGHYIKKNVDFVIETPKKKENKRNLEENKEKLEENADFRENMTNLEISSNFKEKDDILIETPKLKVYSEFPDFILNLSSIKSIFRQETGFFLMLSTSEIFLTFEFLAEQLARMDYFLEEIRSNSEDFCKGFPAINFDDKPLELKLSYKTLKTLFFQEKAVKISTSKLKKIAISLALNEDFLFEISLENANLLNKMPINSINAIIRLDFPDKTGFQLVFAEKWLVEYRMNGFSRDIFLQNLQYLLQRKADISIDFIQSKRLETGIFGLKIEGFLNNEPDPEYEADLLKKILAPKREENFNELLKEFNSNVLLKKLDFVDNKVLICFIEKFLGFLNIFNHEKFKELTEILNGLTMFQSEKNDKKGENGCNFDDNFEDKTEKNADDIFSEKDQKNKDIFEKQREFYQRKLELFKSNFPLKINALSIDLSNYQQICYYLEEILKALSILMTNRGYFKEFATNKKEILYEKFLIHFLSLLKTPHQILSYISFNFLKFFTNFTLSDPKTECLNRYLLINTPSYDIISNLSSFFCEKLIILSANPFVKESFSITGALKLIKTWIKDKKDSTSLEDYEKISRFLLRKELIYSLILVANPQNLELFSKISVFFSLLFEGKMASKLMRFLFENSSIFITFFRAAILMKNEKTRMISIDILHKILVENGEACSLLLRIVPKNLLNIVKTSQIDLTKWTFELWEQFFELLSKDFSSASDIWGNIQRNELMEKLEVFERGFLCRFREILGEKIGNSSGISALNSLGFSAFDEGLLRFNHEEFFIEYDSLKDFCLVGRFYLKKLIKDDENPEFTIKITHVYRFWTELVFAFLAKEEYGEKRLILKVMILLMRDYSEEIKEFSAFSYFLDLLAEDKMGLQYLLLQLIYTSLTRENSKVNIRIFLESCGVERIFLLLARLVCDENEEKTNNLGKNLNENNEENIAENIIENIIENISENISNSKIKDKNQRESLEFYERNYTDGNFIEKPQENRDKNTQEKTFNSVLFVLEIIKALFLEDFPTKSKQELFPEKSLKHYLKNEIYIEILCDCFLMNSTEIWLKTLAIIRKELLSRELLPYFLQYKGFFDFILLRFSPETHQEILDIVVLLKELLIKEETAINYIRMYSIFSFEELAEPTIKKSIEFFPFLRFFPRSLLNRLFEGNSKEFIEIYYCDKYEVPDLIWNKEMRDFLQEYLQKLIKPHHEAMKRYSNGISCGFHAIFNENPPLENYEDFFENQEENGENRLEKLSQNSKNHEKTAINANKSRYSRILQEFRKIPRYKTGFSGVLCYKNLIKEISCGPIFLRIWNQRDFKGFVIEKPNIERFLRALQVKMAYLMQEIKENQQESYEKFNSELLQLLMSLSKAIKRYEIQNYSSFEETIDVLKHFSKKSGFLIEFFEKEDRNGGKCDKKEDAEEIKEKSVKIRISEEIHKENFVLAGLRGIYRAISLENSGNLQNFIRKNGFSFIFEVFEREILEIFSHISKEILLLDVKKLKILIKIIKIFVLIGEKSKEELLSLKSSILSSFFIRISQVGFLIHRFLQSKTLQKTLAFFPSNSSQNDDFSLNFTIFMKDFSRLLEILSIESYLASNIVESGIGFLLLRLSLSHEEIHMKSAVFTNEFLFFYEEFAKSIAFTLRNLNIWAYETYILINNGGLRKLEISSGKAVNSLKTSRIFLGIHKLEKNAKEILASFYEAIYSLILKKNLMNLLSEYEEPGFEKNDKIIEKFLLIINGNNEELRFLWTEETREDLRDLSEKFLMKIAIFGKKDNEKDDKSDKMGDLQYLRDYKYAAFLNELVIEEVFIRVFNRNPEKNKLANSGFFLKLLFIDIEENWLNIRNKKPRKAENTNEKRLVGEIYLYFSKIVQGILACANLLRFMALDSVFLEKNHYKILIISLENSLKSSKRAISSEISLKSNEKTFFEEISKSNEKTFYEDTSLKSNEKAISSEISPKSNEFAIKSNENAMKKGEKIIQKEVFFIFARLTLQNEGIISFLQNKGAILSFIQSFRSNTVFAKDFLLEILKNISQKPHFYAFLAKFGFISLLMEFVLKSEIFPQDLRQKAFDFFLLFLQEKESNLGFIAKIFLANFPLILQKNAFFSAKFIEDLNKNHESFDELWTQLMRKELWRSIQQINDKYEILLEKYQGEFIPLDSQVMNYSENIVFNLKFPEINEEIAINGVFLRSFVKSPAALEEIPAIFFDEIFSRSEKIVEKLEFYWKTEEIIEENAEFRRVFGEFLLISSSFLLAFEEIWLRGKEKLDKEKFAIKSLSKWLDLMKYKGIHADLRCILLQIMLISYELELEIKENDEAMKLVWFLLERSSKGEEDSLRFSKSFFLVVFSMKIL